jgi:hypothetical protein
MPDVNTVVDTYIAMWNERDAARRRDLVAATLSENATYRDPLMSGEGIDGIATMVGRAQEQFAGHRFTLVAGPDAHADRVRFTWSLAADGAAPVAVGVDFATLDGDGRMSDVTGFLEPAA